MLQTLTGGTLLLRNKFFIVLYRGKDFLPSSVATAVLERQELTKRIQDAEENARIGSFEATSSCEAEDAPAGTLAEFYEAQARWGREISAEELEKMREEASSAKNVKEVKKVEHKLALVSILLSPLWLTRLYILKLECQKMHHVTFCSFNMIRSTF